MDYDLRTCDSARRFVLDFMDMTHDEDISKLHITCDDEFEEFWERNIDKIKQVDISNLRIIAFHVLGSLDECKSIKSEGLMNLQEVLTRNTILKRLLNKIGIQFDIPHKLVIYKGKEYDIDYENYNNSSCLVGIYKKLNYVAHRVFYDFSVNGFLLSDNVFNYGTNIDERPEFLMTLGLLFPEARKLESYWRKKSKSYKINFYASINQVERFNFQLDRLKDPPYAGWENLNDEMKIKKWMLSHAIERGFTGLSYDRVLYIKNDVIIPPDQILDISELSKPLVDWNNYSFQFVR